jgi:hypothetical protein
MAEKPNDFSDLACRDTVYQKPDSYKPDNYGLSETIMITIAYHAFLIYYIKVIYLAYTN